MLIMGIWLTRVLLPILGDEAYGFVAFFAASSGVIELIPKAMRQSVVREIGRAYWSKRKLSEVAGASNWLALPAIGMTCALYLMFLIGFGYIDTIPQKLLWPAQLFLISKMVENCIQVLCAPYIHGYQVVGRMASYNLWLTVERLGYLAMSLVLSFNFRDAEPGFLLILYGWLTAGWVVMLQLAATALLLWQMPEMRPRFFARSMPLRVIRLTRSAVLNALVILCTNINFQVLALIVLVSSGPQGAKNVGLGLQLIFYARMVSLGIKDGLSAVATKHESGAGDPHHRLLALMTVSTGMAAAVLIPSVFFIVTNATLLVTIWVGSQLENPTADIPRIVSVVQALGVGVIAISLADIWQDVLLGAGMIRNYAPLLIGGNIFYLPLALISVAMVDDPYRMQTPAIVYSVVSVVVYLVLFPLVMQSRLRLPVRSLWNHCSRGLLLATACALVMRFGTNLLHHAWLINGPWRELGIRTALFGLCYLSLFYRVILTKEMRLDIGCRIHMRVNGTTGMFGFNRRGHTNRLLPSLQPSFGEGDPRPTDALTHKPSQSLADTFAITEAGTYANALRR